MAEGTVPAQSLPLPQLQCRLGQRGPCTYVVHHLLEALAEGAPSDTRKALLSVGEGHGPDARRHPELLHHGVGDASDLPQVILCTWGAGTNSGFLLVILSQGTAGTPLVYTWA